MHWFNLPSFLPVDLVITRKGKRKSPSQSHLQQTCVNNNLKKARKKNKSTIQGNRSKIVSASPVSPIILVTEKVNK